MKYLLFLISYFITTISFSQNDIINQYDSLGKKTGYWIIYDESSKEKLKLQEGYHYNDRKIGLWKRFYDDGIAIKLEGNIKKGVLVAIIQNFIKMEH